MSAYDPRKVLRKISNSLLKQLFERIDDSIVIDWAAIKGQDIEPIYNALLALPDQIVLKVQQVLNDVHGLSDHCGIAIISDEIATGYPIYMPIYEKLEGEHDRVLWTYLNLPEVYEEAARFARVDWYASRSYWKRRAGMPKVKLIITDELLDRFAQELTAYYKKLQLRGKQCVVEHRLRRNGADYFFAYLDNYSKKSIAFEDGSNDLVVQSQRLAFENVFVYHHDHGVLEMMADGGNDVWKALQVAFGHGVLGKAVDPVDPLKPSYQLDHLLKHNHPLDLKPEDAIESVRISQMRIEPIGDGASCLIKIKSTIPGDYEIYSRIKSWLCDDYFGPAKSHLRQATFRIKFTEDDPGRGKSVSFSVSHPSSCNFRNFPDEIQEIVERCLERWKVINDP